MCVSTRFLSYVHQCSRYCAIRFVVTFSWCATNTRRRSRASARAHHASVIRESAFDVQSKHNWVHNKHHKFDHLPLENACVLSFSLLHSISYMIAAIDAMPQLVIQLSCCCFSLTAEDASRSGIYHCIGLYLFIEHPSINVPINCEYIVHPAASVLWRRPVARDARIRNAKKEKQLI